jgi:hypothetical protein
MHCQQKSTDASGERCIVLRLRAIHAGPHLLTDHRWKEQIEQRLEQLEQAQSSAHQPAYAAAPREAHMFGSACITPSTTQPASVSLMKEPAHLGNPGSTGHTSLDFTCSPGAFPASSIRAERAADHSTTIVSSKDVITDGIVSLRSGQAHFHFFMERLNRHIHHVIPVSETLATLRQRSPMLVAAICTVAAFCANSPDYQECLNAYKLIVSAKTFARNHNFDEIRALCIGSFWLNDISYALCSLGSTVQSPLLCSADSSYSGAAGFGGQPTSMHYKDATHESQML